MIEEEWLRVSEEEVLRVSVKLEGRTRASIYEEIDFHSLEERCLKMVF